MVLLTSGKRQPKLITMIHRQSHLATSLQLLELLLMVRTG
jgi:hypothetical protein